MQIYIQKYDTKNVKYKKKIVIQKQIYIYIHI